jgi:starch-binding outer membrane protein, SusD/RagB family
MKNSQYIVVASILSIGLLSCNKYLDKKSDNSLVVPNTVDNLQALLDNSEQINSNTPMYGEISSDNYFLLDATYNSVTELDRAAYRWIPYDYNFVNDWSGAYQVIYTANLCLERLDAIAKSVQNEARWNNVKGSALFLRSYYFLQLAWTHAKAYEESTAQTDLGIPLRTSSDFNIASNRSTVAETYAKVIDDAMESIGYLPDNPQHVMRPSKTAAYGLLARTYLSMRKYDSAFKYADLALSIKSILLDYSNTSEVQATATTPFQPFNKEIIFFSQQTGPWLFNLTGSYALVDTVLYNSYETNDLRKSAYYRPLSGYQRYKNGYTGSNLMFTGIATDEMYLTRAECYARAGNKNAALSDLNTLLSKRWATGMFVPVTAASAQDALGIVLTERRKELVKRGLRWMDIKRLNRENANIVLKRIVGGQLFTLAPNDPKYALPLPKDIIDQTNLQQN